MEGVIDAVTRDLLTRAPGFDWVVTEFVRVVDARLPPRVFYKHCPELVADTPPATPSGVPVTLQLLGSDPAALAANARQALHLGATGVDLNFGCPAKLVNRHDGGASLLRDPRRVHAAVAAVHAAVGEAIPVTAKVRLGFADRRLALACALATQDAGAQRLVVHGRTRDEGYRPPAHWEWIGRIRQRLSIPVVANGDIWTLEDYWKARTLSGCRDVMLGRGALADPRLAGRIRHWQATGERLPETPWHERAAILAEFAATQRSTLPDRVVTSLLKQWLNHMRQRDAEAARRFQALKRITHLDTLLEGLVTPLPCSTPQATAEATLGA
ncbi:tRNA-dihydrouridine synthase [Halomonas saccharevitans]|uniref:tRNA-dihydrouridine(16) synthase n=1 Tax=Halomonas saccharevitans TaxID=416872 RepID=A0A1I6ZI63_9GAMM|nr:tRNA-dihydrouridine synthase [Halomonas saccharevitans]MDT8880059.1 tRNA-dihydrouridine synthase [Halomonas saccharevitans]SFT62360.1 tRNA-dihydrouridine synthase C [Halomonas saccharevitans]